MYVLSFIFQIPKHIGNNKNKNKSLFIYQNKFKFMSNIAIKLITKPFII
ncbi:MAG: hypothetical protein P1U46_00880 [Patescibacteria group bacterium]|nr:hypothetical protein [Patescibacteria group bacterium]